MLAGTHFVLDINKIIIIVLITVIIYNIFKINFIYEVIRYYICYIYSI